MDSEDTGQNARTGENLKLLQADSEGFDQYIHWVHMSKDTVSQVATQILIASCPPISSHHISTKLHLSCMVFV